jgi:uncharacterized protein YfaS (alpha-2-macroglobulin family)
VKLSSFRANRRPLLVLVVLVMGAACMRAGGPPDVVARGTLAPGAQRASARDDGEFRVVFSAPRGQASDVSDISIVFSRSLRSLEVDAPTPAITMSPELPGRWIWVGGRALSFQMEAGRRLPGATKVAVEVPATTRAVDGATLGKPHQFAFETPRPAIARHEPSGSGELPSSRLELFLTQPVEPAELERLLDVRAVRPKREQKIAVRVERPDPKEPKRLRVVPTAPLPLDSEIRATIRPGLRSTEGPLPSEETLSASFSTYGPLRVEEASCYSADRGLCQPGNSPVIRFSNPVSWRAIKAAVRVEPPLPLRYESWQVDSETTTDLYVPAKFLAGQSYTVSVSPELRDRYGQPLGRAFSQTFRYADYDPMLEVGITGQALEPAAKVVVPVGAVNLSGFELARAALTPKALLDLIAAPRPEDQFGIFLGLPGVRRETIASAGQRNTLVRREVDLLGPLAGGRGALGFSAFRKGAPAYESAPRIAKVSDLAITAKIGTGGSLVWVTRLSSGKSVPNAEVELWRKSAQPKTYRTDSDGIARVPAGDFELAKTSHDFKEAALVVAREGKDWTFESVRDHVPSWRLPVSTDLAPSTRPYGMIFTERGVYRPGDEVQVKGIVRREAAAGNVVAKHEGFDLSLRSPQGDVISTQRVTTNDYGTFALALRVPASAGLGGFMVGVRPAEAPVSSPALIWGGFQVAEYRPAEFSVDVRGAKATYVRGERARFEALGNYLYGAPMAGASARFVVSRQPASFEVPGHEGFVIDASELHADESASGNETGDLVRGEGKLDDSGKLAIDQDLALPGQRGPAHVSASVEVTDAAHQTLGGGASVLVHPGDFYVALERPKDWFFTAPGAFTPRVLALGPRGERISGRAVDLELVSRRWTLARETVGGESAHAVSRPVDEVVARCRMTTAREPQGCALKATAGGYFLVVARASDDKKRPLEAAHGVYGLGDGMGGWSDGDQATVALVPDKKEYRVGDTARVLVKSPFPEADALVTVERLGVSRAERVKLRGATPVVTVKITEELRPNTFVAVHLLRARAGRREDKVGASYRIGYAELRVDPELRRLKVAVKPNATDFKPGGEVQVDLAVTDRNGKGSASELTVFAVDEGVLSLTGYATPDPVPVFTASRPLAVATLETRDALAKIGLSELEGLLGADKGRDGGGGGDDGARSNFKQTAFYDPNVRTDASGRARVKFKLPDSLTTYRVMAIALGTDDRYGFGESKVVASKRLMARPALPRFVRAGDVLDASVIVSSRDAMAGKVRVEAKFEGLSLQGEAVREVTLGSEGTREVRFRAHAERVGKAKIAFSVIAGSDSDRVVIEREVEAPAALEAVAVYGTTDESVGEKLGDLRKLRNDTGGLEVTLASTALVGLGSEMRTLSEYPYGCTEQLTSRLLPLVPLSELARDFGLPRPANTSLVIERTIAEILARQRHDGGFGMWPGSPESSEWVSPYALWVLEESAKRGISVPKTALQRGRAFVRESLARSFERDPAASALSVDVLAMLGTPDAGYAQRLLERQRELPTFARGLLLHALAVSRSQGAAGLLQSLEADIRLSGNTANVHENLGNRYAVLMDSPVRTSAIVLRAILAHKPDHPLVEPLARGLLAARGATGFRTTQESAFGLLALDAYRHAREKKAPNFSARAFLGQKQVVSLEARGRSTRQVSGTATMLELFQSPGAVLALDKQGSGSLHYEARLRYAPRDLPARALDQGFFVRKVQRTISPAELAELGAAVPERGSTRFRAADLVLTELVVVAPGSREYVAIDDPLPAGFEAIDHSLAINVLPPPAVRRKGRCDDCEDSEADEDAIAHGQAFRNAHFRQEIRDDRVLYFIDHMPAGMYRYRYLSRATSAGRFVTPPTVAHAMYEPEIFGRTAASLVEIE